MCGRFELKTKFESLSKILKQDYPSGLDSKYETQNLIRPNDPVLVIKNEGLSLIHISEPTRLRRISYAVFCLKKKSKLS